MRDSTRDVGRTSAKKSLKGMNVITQTEQQKDKGRRKMIGVAHDLEETIELEYERPLPVFRATVLQRRHCRQRRRSNPRKRP
jgi:hypothetical protein